MTAAWTVKDSNGQLLANFVCGSPLEVGRKVVRARYDAFRLQVSPSYREGFERAVTQVLKRQGWQIVRMRAPAQKLHAKGSEIAPRRLRCQENGQRTLTARANDGWSTKGQRKKSSSTSTGPRKIRIIPPVIGLRGTRRSEPTKHAGTAFKRDSSRRP